MASSVWVSPRIRAGVPEKGPHSFRSGWSPDVCTRDCLSDLQYIALNFAFIFYISISLFLLLTVSII